MSFLFRRLLPYLIVPLVVIALTAVVYVLLTMLLGQHIPEHPIWRILLMIASLTLTCVVAFLVLLGISRIILKAGAGKLLDHFGSSVPMQAMPLEGNLDVSWLCQEEETRRSFESLCRGWQTPLHPARKD